MEKLPISVIIPTLNRPESLERTIRNIFRWDCQPSEVIVVDQTGDEALRSRNKDCLTVYGDRCRYLFRMQPSLTGARNLGLSAASHEILVFMDDDVDVNEHTFRRICEKMTDPGIAMIAVRNDQDKLQQYGKLGYLFDMKSWRHRDIGHVTSSMLGRYPVSVAGDVDTMWAMGFCFAVRAGLARKWGLKFDEQLVGYAYGEDLDFTYGYYRRAANEGLRCILSEGITVNHLGSQEYRIPKKKNIYMYVIHRTYFAYKHNRGLKSQIAILWTNLGYFLVLLRSKSTPFAVFEAQHRCNQIRKRLKQGTLLETDTQP